MSAKNRMQKFGWILALPFLFVPPGYAQQGQGVVIENNATCATTASIGKLLISETELLNQVQAEILVKGFQDPLINEVQVYTKDEESPFTRCLVTFDVTLNYRDGVTHIKHEDKHAIPNKGRCWEPIETCKGTLP